MHRKFTQLVYVVLFGAIQIAGCIPAASPAPAFQPTATQSPSPVPTVTPTSTPTPSPTPEPTATPTATPTETLTPTKSPEQLAEELALALDWEACNGCVIKPMAVGEMLEGETGVMGYKVEGEKWKTTKGWRDKLNSLYQVDFNALRYRERFGDNALEGVVGEIIDTPIDLYDRGGQPMGQSLLTYFHFYLNENRQLNFRVVSLVAVMEDGTFASISPGSLIYDGIEVNLENLLAYHKERFSLWKSVKIFFPSDSETFKIHKEKKKSSQSRWNEEDEAIFDFVERGLVGKETGQADEVKYGINNGTMIYVTWNNVHWDYEIPLP